jgi:hypothetical protein
MHQNRISMAMLMRVPQQQYNTNKSMPLPNLPGKQNAVAMPIWKALTGFFIYCIYSIFHVYAPLLQGRSLGSQFEAHKIYFRTNIRRHTDPAPSIVCTSLSVGAGNGFRSSQTASGQACSSSTLSLSSIPNTFVVPSGLRSAFA